MKNIWKYILLGLLVLLAIYFLGNRSAKEDKKVSTSEDVLTDIVIGAPLALSGPAAADGEAIKNGMELAVADLKDQGINVTVKYQDDQTDPKQTVSAIRSIGQVDAIVGPTWSFLGDVAVPVFEEKRVVGLMPAGTSEFVQTQSDYIFFGSVKNELKEKPLADFFVENNISNIAFIGGQDAWSESHLKPLQNAAKAAGAEIIINENLPFGSGASEIPTIITKMKDKNIDLVFYTLFDRQAVVKLVNDMDTQGMTAPVISSDTTGRFIYESDNNAFVSTEDLYTFESSIDSKFNNKYQAVYGGSAPKYSDRGYDAVMILVDAIRNRGDKSLSDYLRQDTSYSGFGGLYNFDEKGDTVGGEWLLKPLVE